MLRFLFALALSGLCALSFAQSGSTFPVNGTPDARLELHVYEGARVHTEAGTVLENAHIVVRRGRIEAVGTGPYTTSEPAVRHDVSGHEIYPAFVDLYSGWGLKRGERARWDGKPHYDREDTKAAMGWNSALHPEFDAAEAFVPSEKVADRYRSAGFGAVVAHRRDGIVRGSAALVALSGDAHDAVLEPRAAAWHSFSKGSSAQSYPSSLMGSIALLRQTYCDANWYGQFDAPEERNLSLEAFNAASGLPQFFDAGDWRDILRADKVGDEFGVQYAFLGGGETYRRLDEVAAAGGAVIVPLDFPSAIDVSDPYLARLVSLEEMKHWEWAPYNPGKVAEAGIPMALTMHGLDKGKDFVSNLRKAVEHGLSADAALAALTSVPAKMIDAADRVGRVAPGMEANFIIADGPFFELGTALRTTVVQGVRHDIDMEPEADVAGRYSLNLDGRDLVLELKTGDKGPRGKWWPVGTAETDIDSLAGSAKVSLDGRDLVLRLLDDEAGAYRLVGNVYEGSRIIEGRGERPDGTWIEWAALRQGDAVRKKPEPAEEPVAAEAEEAPTDTEEVEDGPVGPGPITYPFTAYGRTQLPEQGSWHFVGATVWTCGPEGNIENGEVIVHQGRIRAVGQNLDPAAVFGKNIPELIRIDAKGKHLTPGILDEHTHIAASRGINEGTQASSAEVSIGTVVNSEDVNVYRHLAGGVTAGQILHGSANPIGGQSGIIKFRWGMSPEEMQIENADPFIKFALGENVKQSNWGDYQTVRFPQTRMGVEQVYYDHFHRAREYGEEWDAYRAAVMATPRRLIRQGKGPKAPRRDLELETLLQILDSERFVTCHSYRQDEINMLMHVADSMGFTLNTFTHILEGYKVADKMAEHGAGGSSFSDWWAYKFEVKDAIPYNGALLWENGVVTAFNSDDREMARRLNQEAAKANKYGGVPEEEALKFVTLNPAILLHLDDRIGSLEVGKDADMVVWSDHPLSVYAQCEQTYVDGRRLFDQKEDRVMRESMRTERARLIQLMLDAPGADKRKPMERIPPHYHCDTMTEENR